MTKPTKVCSKCHEEKEITEYYRNATRNSWLRPDCKICTVKHTKAYYRNNIKLCAERSARRNLRARYGITPAELEVLKSKRDYKCWICSKDNVKLQIDHDHRTGKIRGMLCFTCNVSLGLFNDDKNTLQNAINYLKESDDAADEVYSPSGQG